MLRQGVHLREVDNVTASCPPNRMDGESTVEMFVENVIHSRKNSLLQHFPTVKGWITWWSLPVHAVLIFPGVRAHMLGETDEMYSLLPSTNNSAESTNSVESRLCRHNVELIPAIHDSWRMTLRQQRLHEVLLSGAAPTASACSY